MYRIRPVAVVLIKRPDRPQKCYPCNSWAAAFLLQHHRRINCRSGSVKPRRRPPFSTFLVADTHLQATGYPSRPLVPSQNPSATTSASLLHRCLVPASQLSAHILQILPSSAGRSREQLLTDAMSSATTGRLQRLSMGSLLLRQAVR